jgi:hypothetical protein
MGTQTWRCAESTVAGVVEPGHQGGVSAATKIADHGQAVDRGKRMDRDSEIDLLGVGCQFD